MIYRPIVLPFSTIPDKAECLINSTPITSKHKLITSNNFFYVWSFPRQNNVGQPLYSWQQRHLSVISRFSFMTLFIRRYNESFLLLIWKFFLIPNTVNKFLDLREQLNILPSTCINSARTCLISADMFHVLHITSHLTRQNYTSYSLLFFSVYTSLEWQCAHCTTFNAAVALWIN